VLIEDKIFIMVAKELERANSKFPQFNSEHEGIAVIREEYLELEAEIFHGTVLSTRDEAVQLAAMACKLLQFLSRYDGVF
jgi:hypothetical protein